VDTTFYIPLIKRIPTYIEFIIQNGEVQGLYSIQDKKTNLGKQNNFNLITMKWPDLVKL
jgi:hypothetical protein